MSKKSIKQKRESVAAANGSNLKETKNKVSWLVDLKKHWWAVAAIVVLSLGAFGAGLKYLEEDASRQMAFSQTTSTKEQTLLNRINPFLAPLPSSTPELSKEYIYAGDRLLAVEDANATAVPPADLAVWRPSTGVWYVLGANGTQTIEGWGINGDKPAPGDYDGDGKTDFSVFRSSNNTWYVMRSSDGNWDTYNFGLGTDVLAPADYDGDGRTDPAVWRPSTGVWYIRESSTQSLIYPPFGMSGDIPVPADYDGDGKADLAVWRENDPLGPTFYVQRSSDLTLQFQTYGIANDVPAVADYDGDGLADYSVRRGASWYILQSSTGTTISHGWGNATDKEVPNDYDGDGKADIAVWREYESSPGAGDGGTWFISNSSGNPATRIVQWGAVGDIPVPAYYRRQ